MHFYDIYPQIVPADKVSKITIHPRFSHAKFSTQSPWVLEMKHSPREGVVENDILDAYVWASKDGVDIKFYINENDDIIVEGYFAGEQEHNLQLRVTRSDNPDYFKNYSFKIYSLKEDLYNLRPIKIDSHIHTSGSDGKEDCRFVSAKYREKGFDAIAITDHRNYKPSVEAKNYWENIAPDFNIIYGEEVHSPNNPVHIVNFGGSKSINDEINSNSEEYFRQVAAIESNLPKTIPSRVSFACAASTYVFDSIRKAGGLAVFCHPYWCMSRSVLPEALIDAIFSERKFDAVEIIGGFYKEQSEANNFQIIRCHEEAYKQSFPILAASDSHGTCQFPINRFLIGNFCGLSTTNSADAELFNWYYSIVFSLDNKTNNLISAIKENLVVAIEEPTGSIPRIYGNLRLVKYASFLLREYFPIHDQLCKTQGSVMLDYLAGDTNALVVLENLKGRVNSRCEKFFGN